jgi:hypothetical protein
MKILASEAKRDKEGKETVEGRGKGKGVAVGSRKAVGWNRGTKMTSYQNAAMSEEEERRPQDGRTDGEMVLEMTGARPEVGLGLAEGIETSFTEGLVGFLVVMSKVETMLNKRRASVSVVANPIAANPGIDKRQGKNKKDNEDTLKRARLDVRVSVQGDSLQTAGIVRYNTKFQVAG